MERYRGPDGSVVRRPNRFSAHGDGRYGTPGAPSGGGSDTTPDVRRQAASSEGGGMHLTSPSMEGNGADRPPLWVPCEPAGSVGRPVAGHHAAGRRALRDGLTGGRQLIAWPLGSAASMTSRAEQVSSSCLPGFAAAHVDSMSWMVCRVGNRIGAGPEFTRLSYDSTEMSKLLYSVSKLPENIAWAFTVERSAEARSPTGC